MKLFQKKTVDPEDNPLLYRYILFRCSFLGIYLHHLMRSDHDRALHDHPWGFVSVLLTSQYREYTPQGSEVYRRGQVLFRPARWLHRLELAKPMWTLVLVGRRTRKWGFLTQQGWCWWRKYNYTTAICEDEILWEDNSD